MITFPASQICDFTHWVKIHPFPLRNEARYEGPYFITMNDQTIRLIHLIENSAWVSFVHRRGHSVFIPLKFSVWGYLKVKWSGSVKGDMQNSRLNGDPSFVFFNGGVTPGDGKRRLVRKTSAEIVSEAKSMLAGGEWLVPSIRRMKKLIERLLCKIDRRNTFGICQAANNTTGTKKTALWSRGSARASSQCLQLEISSARISCLAVIGTDSKYDSNQWSFTFGIGGWFGWIWQRKQ